MDVVMKPELQPHAEEVHRPRKSRPQPAHIYGEGAMAATASDVLSHHALAKAKEQSREQMRAASEQRTSEKPYTYGVAAPPLRRGKAHVGPVSIAAEFPCPREDPCRFLGSGRKRVESPASDAVNIATPTACEPERPSPSSIARARKNAASSPAGRLASFQAYPKVRDGDSSSEYHGRVLSRVNTPSSTIRLDFAEERGPVVSTPRPVRAKAQYVPPGQLAWTTRYAWSSPPTHASSHKREEEMLKP
jgi:hypothetical protein